MTRRHHRRRERHSKKRAARQQDALSAAPAERWGVYRTPGKQRNPDHGLRGRKLHRVEGRRP